MPIQNHLSNGCSFSTKKTYQSAYHRLGSLLGLNDTVMSAIDGHPNQQGHHAWANLIYNFVKEKKLLLHD